MELEYGMFYYEKNKYLPKETITLLEISDFEAIETDDSIVITNAKFKGSKENFKKYIKCGKPLLFSIANSKTLTVLINDARDSMELDHVDIEVEVYK